MSVDALEHRLCQRIGKPASSPAPACCAGWRATGSRRWPRCALTAIVLAALFAPWIAPYDPYFTDLTKVMQPPGAEHWFGTDNTGRDILSRVIYGTRNTLMLGLVGVIVGGADRRRARHPRRLLPAAGRLDHAAGRHDAGIPRDPDRACGGRDLRRRAWRRS